MELSEMYEMFMGYFMDVMEDGTIVWRKDKGYRNKKIDKKKYKRIRKMKKVGKRANHKSK